MNKLQAADFLGVSVQALEQYVQQGRISVKYEKGKIRPTANFDFSELEAFKEEFNQPIVKPAFESRQITTEQQPLTNKLVHQSGEVTEFDEIGVNLEFCTVCTVSCTSTVRRK
ncbi:helix-turn-helix domain-containing protein [Nostoc sp.]|uniref:helix-turn-helix domain-containing protein n=1 Tax=Nostoc sp. TaxID=1180 RepID=UPI002FF906EE